MRRSGYCLLLFAILAAHALAAGQVAPPKPVRCVLWSAPASQKVFREDRPPLWAQLGANAKLRLAAARNEVEAAQLVIHPKADARLTTATVSPLRGPGQAVLAAERIQIDQVGYVYLPTHNRAWPDPLPPLQLPLALFKHQAQPLWISVSVPGDAAPGIYRGELTLCVNGLSMRRVPLELTVWPLDVPTRPSMRTAFGLDYESVARQHGVTSASAAGIQLKKAYYEFLLAHRISAYDLPCSLEQPEAARYLDDPRVTSYLIPYSADEAALGRTVARLREKGWLAKGYFYVVDEPTTDSQYRLLRESSALIHKVAPEARIVSPFYRDPDFAPGKTAYDLLPGLVNIWCPLTRYYQSGPMHARQRLGEEAWWYVCCVPPHPYANLMVDWSGPSHRILPWQQRQNHVTGLLFWNTTMWNPEWTLDPWSDIATYKNNGKVFYGDGSLLYPGRRVGLAGPVSSIRLELLRDGLEDYEYLQLYGQRFGEEALQAQLGRVSKDLTHFSDDPARLEGARRRLVKALAR